MCRSAILTAGAWCEQRVADCKQCSPRRTDAPWIFYGQYKRITSYFEGTELGASGLPGGRELAILETLRDEVPPEVFTTPYP